MLNKILCANCTIWEIANKNFLKRFNFWNKENKTYAGLKIFFSKNRQKLFCYFRYFCITSNVLLLWRSSLLRRSMAYIATRLGVSIDVANRREIKRRRIMVQLYLSVGFCWSTTMTMRQREILGVSSLTHEFPAGLGSFDKSIKRFFWLSLRRCWPFCLFCSLILPVVVFVSLALFFSLLSAIRGTE